MKKRASGRSCGIGNQVALRRVHKRPAGQRARPGKANHGSIGEKTTGAAEKENARF